MANGTVQINNLSSGVLSLDIKLSEDKVIREKLAIGGSYDCGDLTSVEELNANPDYRRYKDAGQVDLTLVRGDDELGLGLLGAAGKFGAPLRISAAIANGAGGAGDDTLVASMPFAAKILDYQILVDDAEAATWTLRDALAGGGNALSDNLSSASAGRVRDAGAALAGVVPTIAKGSPLVLRRSENGSNAGTVIVDIERTS